MAKIIRLRGRNQITIPMRIAEQLGLQEDDFVAVTVNEEEKTLTLRPARIVTAGTPEAKREEARAAADLVAGRVRVFDSPEAYAKDLEARSAKAVPELPPIPESSKAGVQYRDKVLKCSECGTEFVFTAGEQKRLADVGMEHAPKSCEACRFVRSATGAKASGFRKKQRSLRQLDRSKLLR